MKRSPMPRRAAPLAATGSLPPGRRLRPRSAKREAENAVRGPLARLFLIAHPICMWCQAAPATDVHERKKRSREPGAHLDPFWYVALCRVCHERTESHPNEATAAGMLVPSWVTKETLAAYEVERRAAQGAVPGTPARRPWHRLL